MDIWFTALSTSMDKWSISLQYEVQAQGANIDKFMKFLGSFSIAAVLLFHLMHKCFFIVVLQMLWIFFFLFDIVVVFQLLWMSLIIVYVINFGSLFLHFMHRRLSSIFLYFILDLCLIFVIFIN